MTVFDAGIDLAPRHWQAHFSRKILARGDDYWRKGRIGAVSMRWHGATVHLAGDVQGSEDEPYQVTVELEVASTGLYPMHGECDCPMGFDCKHMVALLLAAHDALAGHPAASSAAGPRVRSAKPAAAAASVTPWELWMRGFAQTPAASVAAADPARKLAFLFDINAHPKPARVLVHAAWVTPLKGGRLGKAEPVARRFGAPSADWDALDARRHDLLARLRMQAPVPRQGKEWYQLEGARGEELLLQLLENETCFWQRPTQGELKLAAARELAWRWQVDDIGNQQLQPQLPDDVVPLQVHGLWYLQAAVRQLGRLGGDAALAQRLLHAPALAPEHVAGVRKQWPQHPQLQVLPPPEPLGAPEKLNTKPVPVLRLHALPLKRDDYGYRRKQDQDADPSQPCARLEFEYGPIRLACGGLRGDHHVRRVHAGKLFDILRNPRAESDALELLHRQALAPVSQRYDLHWRLHDATPADFVCSQPIRGGEGEHLLQHALALQAQGFKLEFDPSYPIECVSAPQQWQLDASEESGGNDWFNLELGIEIQGERVSLLPILRRALLDRSLSMQPPADEPADALWYAPLDARRRLPLPLAQVRALLAPLLQWLDGDGDGEQLRVPRIAANVLDELSAASRIALQNCTSQGLRKLADSLRESGLRPRIAPPPGLAAELREYQRDGLDWLGFLASAGLGGVLADDMGLGKTLQVLAHILAEKRGKRLPHPALVVTATSVVGHWREQAARFTPKLRVLTLHGSDRHPHYEALADCDIAITTYALLPRDREALLKQRFTIAVFDEAQAIKNPRAKAAVIARELQAQRRLAVTGTPLENHLGELWTQFDCVLPGLLGDSQRFVRVFRTPIEKHGDRERQRLLNRRIAPFLLRRNKEQVASELPPKSEIVQNIELAGSQRRLYETLRLAMHEKVQQAIAKRGLARSSIVILDALLKLRQACCDPRLVKLDAARRGAGKRESAKLDALLPMLEELLAEGRRILLFSQFTQMLDLIEAELESRAIDHVRLDGSTRDRQTPVRRFQNGESPLFLVSLKAGGVGLNLTAADTVIHYDPWWNPAVERQATDRAHRIGQDKPVFVYKLICTGTVEEKIQSMQQRKATLAQAVLDGGAKQALQFDENDIRALFAPL